MNHPLIQPGITLSGLLSLAPNRLVILAWGSCLVLAGCGAVAQTRNADGARLFQQGNYPVAYQRFQQALQSNPQNPDSYYNLAAVRHRIGVQNRDNNALAEAEQLYNQALDYDPNHVDAHRGLAVLLTETNRSDKALNLLRNWATTSPTNADARVELARLYEEFGDPRTAEQHLLQAITLDVNNSRGHAALGRIKEQLGDVQQAVVNYQRAYSLNRNQPQIAERIALLTGQSRGTGFGNTPAQMPGFNSPGGGFANLPSNQNASRPRADLRY